MCSVRSTPLPRPLMAFPETNEPRNPCSMALKSADKMAKVMRSTGQGFPMLRYTFRQLEYFVAVGETGSIARASERINVSSPSISSAISQLEAESTQPENPEQN